MKTGVGLGEDCGGKRLYWLNAVAGASQGRIVHDDGDAICAQPHVELERVGPLLERKGKLLHGVLRRETARAPMTDHRMRVGIEQEVHP